ncbi:MAG: thiosulfate oxidation carrier complex protein SoxZ [Lysobacterales bacterium]
MAQTIKIRIRREGERAEVRALIIHPMETGLRKDPLSGDTVPRHHITRISFAHNGRVVLVAHCSTAVAKNPFFDFSFDGVRVGDRFSTEWVDTLGVTDALETVVE